MSSDISKMSDEFHDWLEKCPVQWSKKHGEATYTFWGEESEEMSSDKEQCTLCEGTGFDCDERCDDCNGSGEVSINEW